MVRFFILYLSCMPVQKILIAGIGGFIGKRLAEMALQQGYVVYGFDREIEPCRELTDKGVQVFSCDIADTGSLSKILHDKPDVVVNTIAVVKETGDWDLFRKINVDATVCLAELAKASGVKQFIQLSSVMVYGLYYEPGVDEHGHLAGDGNPYCTTKIEGETALNKLSNKKFGVTIIRPGDVYGPGSIPWVIRPLGMRKKNQFVLVDEGIGAFNYVYIDNLVQGILQTIEQQKTGSAYNMVDGCVTNKEYFTRLMEIAGYGELPSVPSEILYPLSKGWSAVLKIFKSESAFTPQAIDYMRRPGAYSGEKAKNELGYVSAVSLEKGMLLTREWLHNSRPDLVKK
jgi:nucleoside-diphosphate-sugar epimerase